MLSLQKRERWSRLRRMPQEVKSRAGELRPPYTYHSPKVYTDTQPGAAKNIVKEGWDHYLLCTYLLNTLRPLQENPPLFKSSLSDWKYFSVTHRAETLDAPASVSTVHKVQKGTSQTNIMI